MDNLGTFLFKDLNTKKSTPEELFTNAYVEQVYESEHINTAKKLLRVILDAKYEKVDLHKVMEIQCQHLTVTKCNELLKLLHKSKELFDVTPVTWKTDPLVTKLKYNVNELCWRPYPVPKLHK